MAKKKDIVISLFDFTGSSALGYSRSGYTVICIDIKNGIDILKWNYLGVDKDRVAVVMAAPPCTDYASSGGQYFKTKDRNGSTAKSNLLVNKTLEIVDYFRPEAWQMENPKGRLRRMLAGMYLPGEPRLVIPESLKSIVSKPRLIFNPNDYGDPWTKQTYLWGTFNIPQKYPVGSVKWSKQGSWSQLLGGKSERTKELRSVTPPGFARFFFEANNPLNGHLPEHLFFFGRCKFGHWTCDFSVSKKMCDMCDEADNYEPNPFAMEFDDEEEFLMAVFDKGEGIRKSVDPERITNTL